MKLEGKFWQALQSLSGADSAVYSNGWGSWLKSFVYDPKIKYYSFVVPYQMWKDSPYVITNDEYFLDLHMHMSDEFTETTLKFEIDTIPVPENANKQKTQIDIQSVALTNNTTVVPLKFNSHIRGFVLICDDFDDVLTQIQIRLTTGDEKQIYAYRAKDMTDETIKNYGLVCDEDKTIYVISFNSDNPMISERQGVHFETNCRHPVMLVQLKDDITQCKMEIYSISEFGTRAWPVATQTVHYK